MPPPLNATPARKGVKSSGRLLGLREKNYGNAEEMDEQHFVTINQGRLINKVHFILDDSGDYQKDTVLVILINKAIVAAEEDALKGDAFLSPIK